MQARMPSEPANPELEMTTKAWVCCTIDFSIRAADCGTVPDGRGTRNEGWIDGG